MLSPFVAVGKAFLCGEGHVANLSKLSTWPFGQVDNLAWTTWEIWPSHLPDFAIVLPSLSNLSKKLASRATFLALAIARSRA
jgi:hypothetical protein